MSKLIFILDKKVDKVSKWILNNNNNSLCNTKIKSVIVLKKTLNIYKLKLRNNIKYYFYYFYYFNCFNHFYQLFKFIFNNHF